MLNCSVEQPTMLPIKKIIDEADGFKTFIFKAHLGAKPGQFVMFWIPGVEMKPFSISYQDDKEFHLTVMKVGAFTKAMFKLKAGDKVGIQGPYGRPFTFNKAKKIAIVGGGCGIAPVFMLLHAALAQKKEVYFVAGCRNKKVFIKEKAIKKAKPKQSIFMTDDGSLGDQGFTTDALEQVIKKNKVGQILTCGPEIMMVKVAQLAKKYKIPCQVSMERYMICGIGVCGQCCMDDCGLRVCHDGPIFEGPKLLASSEFGKYRRDNRGRKVKI